MIEPAAYMAGPGLGRLQRRALVVGLAAGGLCVISAFRNPAQFFHSYLLAFLFWAGIPLGCLAIVMLHHLTGGGWGLVIRRPLESATRTLPLIGLLFVPLFLGVRWIYGWAQGVPLPRPQVLYFDRRFFLLRAALYFGIWLGLAFLLGKWSREQGTARDSGSARKMRLLSGPGLVLYGLAASFAAVDWILSLEPGWYSTIIGMLFITGQLLSALSFTIVVLVLLAAYTPIGDLLQPRHLHDLGKLLLTFVMLWAYMAFSQLLIIWAENLPDEIPYYLHRLAGGWLWVGVALILFHFMVPFFLLLSRDLKRNATALAVLASLIVIMRAVDMFWYTGPAFSPGSFHIDWMDVLAPVGIGGLWISYFSWQLKRFPLLPIGDPRLAEGLKKDHE
jgi:hypothetical protein